MNTGAGDTLSVDRSTASKFGVYAALMNYSRTSFVAYLEQGVESWASLEGQWLTFSAWLYSNTSDTVRLRIWDWDGTSESAGSSLHTGTGWEHITVSKLIRSGLTSYSAWPHSFGIRVGMVFEQSVTGARIDGATLVVGKYPEGVPYVPLDPATDLNRARRYCIYHNAFQDGTLFSGGDVTSGGAYWATFTFPTIMESTPTITMTNVANSNFPATVGGAAGVSNKAFYEGRVANGTGRGYFGSTVLAEVT